MGMSVECGVSAHNSLLLLIIVYSVLCSQRSQVRFVRKVKSTELPGHRVTPIIPEPRGNLERT